MNPLDLLAVAVVLLTPFNWGVAWYLRHLSNRHPDLPTLSDRAFAQFWLAIGASIGGFFGVVHLLGAHLLPGVTTILLILALIVPSVPATKWFVTYWTGRFE